MGRETEDEFEEKPEASELPDEPLDQDEDVEEEEEEEIKEVGLDPREYADEELRRQGYTDEQGLDRAGEEAA